MSSISFQGVSSSAEAFFLPPQNENFESDCPENFLEGRAPELVNPRLRVKAQELCFSEFAVRHSGLTRTALYAADHLSASRVERANAQSRKDAAMSFHEEPRLPEDERSTLQDYAHSGYDRGHLCPNGDFDNPIAQGESFSMANMVPQNPNNNRNLWEGIEEVTRSMAQQHGDVWVVNVPIFAGAQTSWLNDRVAIPGKMAKAVYVPELKGAAVYLTPNAPGMAWQAISVARLREISGIDPFPSLSEDIKQKVMPLPHPTPHGKKAYLPPIELSQ